jgi:hypothetical protein
MARFTTKAMMVSIDDNRRLGAPGHIPEKRAIPRVEMTADTITSCRQESNEVVVLQKDQAAARKPIAEGSQKKKAIAEAAFVDKEGNNHDRMGIQSPVR